MNSTQAFYIHGLRLRYLHGRTIHPPLNHTALDVGYRGGIVCFLLKSIWNAILNVNQMISSTLSDLIDFSRNAGLSVRMSFNSSSEDDGC
jgi:hypothetical protein